MIILYEEDEKKFETLGIGILKDIISASITESLNDSFELEISYPVTGKLFNELKIDRIICCKSNPYDPIQPFRIYSITKPIDGIVTVSANHISYDMNGIPVTAIDGNNLSDIINKLQNGWDEEIQNGNEIETVHKKCVLLDNPFKFNTDIFSAKTFKTSAPYNLRSLLMGGDESIVSVYDGEMKFDKCNISILTRRGEDRGAKVVYGHNMTDLNHEIMSENLYNGIFPYYHSEKTSNETETNDEFKKVYIVGTKPFASDWLSYTDAGEAFIPVSQAPIQIDTEGDYYEKIFAWNETNQRYEEKIYNEQVNLIQGVFTPTWISIDWSKFPIVTCRANKVGYFKKSTDTDWGDKKGVGDVIFSESLIGGGIMQNIMLCFSEVIPSDSTSTNSEVSEVIDVTLDDPIMWIKDKPDTRNMLHDRILNVDLTSEFEETPTKDQLKKKAEEFINKNKIGIVKHNTTVSFVDLASTTESDKYQNFDHIELGDTVEVIYQDLGVDIKLRVISTTYDAVADRYDSIELGEKEDKMSSQNIQIGDNVSSLSNDAGYTDVTTVNKLIAQTVTAEYIEAVNARLSKASIKQLEAERIDVTGIIEASQFSLDSIVAKLLTADNAEIKAKLKAGEIEVAGDITINSGEISITSENGNTSFYVDRNGNATANSMVITGGSFDIGDGNFTVQNDGTMFAKDANIEGTIKANVGEIGDFYIIDKIITTDKDYNKDSEEQTKYKSGEIYITPNAIKAGNDFEVTSDGGMRVKKASFGSDKIVVGDDYSPAILNSVKTTNDGIGIGEAQMGLYKLPNRNSIRVGIQLYDGGERPIDPTFVGAIVHLYDSSGEIHYTEEDFTIRIFFSYYLKSEKDKEVVNAWIIPGQLATYKGWLTDVEGSTIPLTPSQDKLYIIKTKGTYYNAVFGFDPDSQKYVKKGLHENEEKSFTIKKGLYYGDLEQQDETLILISGDTYKLSTNVEFNDVCVSGKSPTDINHNIYVYSNLLDICNEDGQFRDKNGRSPLSFINSNVINVKDDSKYYSFGMQTVILEKIDPLHQTERTVTVNVESGFSEILAVFIQPIGLTFSNSGIFISSISNREIEITGAVVSDTEIHVLYIGIV